MAVQTINNEIAEEKLKAINNIEGKYLVIAGPGTGKTFTLSQRIKNILLNGKGKNGQPTSPERVLCLSYTNTAAKEMDSAIKVAMEDDTVEVYSTTFHSFCNNIVSKYAKEFDFGTDDIRLMTDNIGKIFLKEIIDDNSNDLPKLLKKNGKKYNCISSVFEKIKKIKNNGFFHTDKDKFEKALYDAKYFGGKLKLYEKQAEALEELINERISLGKATAQLENRLTKLVENTIPDLQNEIAEWLEVFDFYIKLTEKMQKYGYLDFDDMILMIINKFETDRKFLELVADDYDYILADEYQDTNPIQNKIIEYLGGEGGCPNIFAVGDDDQSIYSFQGAKASAMKDFIEKIGVPKEHIYCLTENRRSLQNILDISRVIADIQNDYSEYYIYREMNKSKPKPEDIENFITQYNQIYLPLVADPNFKNFINKRLTQKSEKLPQSKPVKCYEYDYAWQEMASVVNKIVKLKEEIESGEIKSKLSEIAILTTSNEELAQYSELLEIKGIPYEIKGGDDLFKIKAVNILIAYLQLLVNPDMYSDKFYSYLLSQPFNLPFSDYKKIFKKKAKYRSLIELLEAPADTTEEKENKKANVYKFLEENNDDPIKNDLMSILKNTSFSKSDEVKNFLETYKELVEKKRDTKSIKSLILDVANKTGILKYFTENDIDNKTKNILGIKKLTEIAEEYEMLYKDNSKDSTLYNFVEYITMLSKSDKTTAIDKPLYRKDAVQLTTYHSAKGREFEYVFMPNLVESKWERYDNHKDVRLNLDKFDKDDYNKLSTEDDIKLALNILEEEKRERKFMERIRLLFVGITRAKHTLILSSNNEKDKSWFLTKIKEKYPTDISVYEEISVTTDEEEEINIYADLMLSTDYDHKEDYIDFVDYRIDNLEPYSPSSVNSYLKCPRKFFYENILGLTPGLKDETNTIYGIAMHYACEQAVNHIVEEGGENPLTIDEFYKLFKEKLERSSIDKDVLDTKLNDGRISIYGGGEDNKSSFYEFFNKVPTDKYFKVECKVKGKLKLNDGKIVELEGIIDRLDYDKNTGEYSIIDYKATEDAIENKIKPAGEKENYYNQIAIYKYMLTQGDFFIDDEYYKDGLNVKSTQFYLTDRKKDEQKLVNLPLSDNDCKEVKDKFVKAIENIRRGVFGGTSTDKENTCKYCHNKNYCHFEKIDSYKKQCKELSDKKKG